MKGVWAYFILDDFIIVTPTSGDVIVTPFVGADDENDGTVAPPQGSEFFKDVEGNYYDCVLSQSLIGLRAAMSLALPARRCYQSSRD